MFEGRIGDRVDGVKTDYGYVETDSTGRYGRFDEVLGKGATKTVYRAFDELKGMEVAWSQAKLNDVFQSPEECQRLYSEVHLLGTLSHDSIIKFYASWIDIDKRTLNFITEMFTSGTLREYRRRYKRVDIRAVKNWARQILHGLVYLHGHDPPVIHRDLKCDNIFVNGHLGQVKIGDFGLAATLRGSQAAHSVIGTPEFMAPELYEEEYNELVDVYSFGMCVLEMLTSEFPYSECCNPAQIYKKVTCGKLPNAFYRIHDLEARRFVGKCLETASKRLSAKELLLDPFLLAEEGEVVPVPKCVGKPTPISDEITPEIEANRSTAAVYEQKAAWSSDMTITGKMNPEDDTIFLKVQIADKDGNMRNIYFPFDIITDTPIDVATEMVKELEITDRDPIQIAEVIDDEISALVPHWKERGPSRTHHHKSSLSYQDEDDGTPYPFCSPPSPCSSQASYLSIVPPHGTQYLNGDGVAFNRDWLRDHENMMSSADELLTDDETSSQSSLSYSNWNYHSANERDHELSPREELHHFPKNHKSSRLCPKQKPNPGQSSGATCCNNHYKSPQQSSRPSSHFGWRHANDRCLTGIRSFVDLRTQLLHQSLSEEVNKRRLFKTVGAVENIGFQTPLELSREFSSGSSKVPRDDRKQGLGSARR